MPGFWPIFIAEINSIHEPSLPGIARYAAADFDIGGVTQTGEQLVVCWFAESTQCGGIMEKSFRRGLADQTVLFPKSRIAASPKSPNRPLPLKVRILPFAQVFNADVTL
jgi:hypothetical protein